MADDSEHEDDRDVRLCTKTVVMYGKGEQWIPTQKNEEGMVWFSVNGRWDRGFTKFVFGKALDLRKDKDSRSLNSKFFDDLMTQRQTTFNEVIQKRLQSEDDDQEDTPPQNKKVFKSFKATAAKHQQYAPYYIDMQLPAIEEGGPTPTAKVLFEGLGSHTLWFELTEANLRHLKAGFVNSESKESVDWSSFMQVELLGGMEETEEGMWTSQSGELRWTKGKGWRILIKDGGMCLFRHPDKSAEKPPPEGWEALDFDNTWIPSTLRLEGDFDVEPPEVPNPSLITKYSIQPCMQAREPINLASDNSGFEEVEVEMEMGPVVLKPKASIPPW
ncbi:unnamed protein product [Symbiodinium sp. CCMP2592]|nr:unnamed protein product [Symbiodinium sp. CCMP2592]